MNSIQFAGRRSRRVIQLVVGCGLVVCLFAGCDPPQVASTRGTSTAESTAQADHLTKVFDLMERVDDFTDDRSLPEMIYHLNQWQESQERSGEWKPDPLVERLPRSLKQFITTDVLTQPSFDVPDVSFLRESMLLRDAAQWAGRRPTDEGLESWIRRDSGLTSVEADELITAARLFDWTVRNIQLDELLPYPQEDAAGPTAKPADDGGAALELPAPLRAQPGPGYQHEPIQIILGGHGDSIERARLFALLARQQQIETVVLAVYDVKTSPRPRPWTVGVLIGERLYLFDASLGLPLPGPDGQGVATLDDVRKTPNYFEALRGDSGTSYPFTAADLGNLVALIDASPLSLTRRMQTLERGLVGRQQAVLTTRPSALGDRVRKLPGINSVGILASSWEAPLYRAAIMQMARVNSQAAAAALQEEALFRESTPVGQGRWRYLQGRFENEEREKGAKALYIAARIPDAILAGLRTDKESQRQLQLIRPDGMSDQAWQARVLAAEYLFRQAKINANYWLGVVHMETDRAEAAVEWFKKRTLEADPPSRWKNGARYNLARCFEQQGKLAEARALYREDDSPQRLGNLLRARRLAAGKAGKGSESSKPEASKPAPAETTSQPPAAEKPTPEKPESEQPGTEKPASDQST